MNPNLATLLPKARGVSEFVVAMNLDIRDFTSFSNQVESSEAALFLKKVYMKLIEEYFGEASFLKLTGDGLMVVQAFEEENLEETLVGAVQKSLDVVRAFPTLLDGDRMINFEVPNRIGIGLARGAATCLVSGDIVLDYSGKPLNLASRLMDLARPSGVVLDQSFNIGVLPKDLAKLFKSDQAYLRGIAPRDPLTVFYTSGLTVIPIANKQPIDKIRWQRQDDKSQTLRVLKKMELFEYDLKSEPLDPSSVQVRLLHDSFDSVGRRIANVTEDYTIPDFTYVVDAGQPKVKLDLVAIRSSLMEKKVKDTTALTIRIEYQVA